MVCGALVGCAIQGQHLVRELRMDEQKHTDVKQTDRQCHGDGAFYRRPTVRDELNLVGVLFVPIFFSVGHGIVAAGTMARV